MKNIYKILILAVTLVVIGACSESYNPLPPKTDSSVQYALPYPETPDQNEIDALKKIRSEHTNAIK